MQGGNGTGSFANIERTDAVKFTNMSDWTVPRLGQSNIFIKDQTEVTS